MREKEEEKEGKDLICEFVFLLIVERQFVVQDIVEILLHEHHGVGETVLLVVSAVIHVRVITEDETKHNKFTKKKGKLMNSDLSPAKH